jgi:hypothetical protein
MATYSKGLSPGLSRASRKSRPNDLAKIDRRGPLLATPPEVLPVVARADITAFPAPALKTGAIHSPCSLGCSPVIPH